MLIHHRAVSRESESPQCDAINGDESSQKIASLGIRELGSTPRLKRQPHAESGGDANGVLVKKLPRLAAASV